MTRVLALDTATQACTLALWDEGKLCLRHELLARAHNRHILGMLSEILDGERLADAVDIIACGVGPGSFTGLRVAVSVAQGLAWSQHLPVHGFCSLTAQVYSAGSARLLEDGDRVLSTIDAQIDQLYGVWGTWQGEQFTPDAEAFICAPEELPTASSDQPVTVLGSGERYLDRFPPSLACAVRRYPDVTPDAGVMAGLLGTGQLSLDLQPAHAVRPQYVQKNIGWKKLSEQGRHD
jgi:tRNA threonylcarbamoyladenosine biosynthesis protein TsaB